MMLWATIAVAALLLAGVILWIAPARTTIIVDTHASAARAEMRTLWGLGPTFQANALPKGDVGNPLAVFNDVPRIAHALVTPGLANVAYSALQGLFRLKPRAARVELGVNLGDNAQNLVVQTAAEGALATAPAAIRESVVVTRCAIPGAELQGNFELYASPMQLASIYSQLKKSEPAREFRRRLKRKIKSAKHPPREVRTS